MKSFPLPCPPVATLVALIFCFGGWLRAAESAGKNYFNVRDYGAVGDGTNLDSPAINVAITNAAQAGGGTVLVPAGTYLCGSIHLQSNIQLLIDAGATILGAPQELKAYDPAEPFAGKAWQDGGHTFFHNSLIWGEGLTNVSICGRGRINGGGLVHGSSFLDHLAGYAMPPSEPKSPDDLRIGDKSICLKLCRNVLIRDVTIFHGGWFAILVTGCDDMTIDNVTIDTQRDGMDLDCCRNTVVSNCHVNSPNDDGICPKSSYGLGELRVTENLSIVNCQVSGFEEGTFLDGTMKPSKNQTGRIKFGTEASGGFRNCTVANCTFRSCRGLALEEVDGGILEDISVNNLTMIDVRDYAIYITAGKRNRTPDVATKSRVHNVLISNVIADGVGEMSGIQLMGLPEQPLDGIRLENIRLTSKGGGTAEDAAIEPKEIGAGYPEPSKLGTLPAYGVFARHVHDLELENITVNCRTNDLRSPAIFSDIDGLEIDDFKAQAADGVAPAVIGADVRGMVVRNSPMLDAAKK